MHSADPAVMGVRAPDGPARRLLAVALALVLSFFVAPWDRAAAAPGDQSPAPYDQDLRPQFHFSAKENWLNDPNGLVYYKGVYHLFFQHNPFGNTWGNMSWGHATSTDLVRWTEQPVAIPQTFNDAGESIEDIFSGSAVVDWNNTSGFGSTDNPPMVAIYTSAYTPKHPTLAGRQAQSLAYSTDEGQTWTKYSGNPVLDIGSGEFRDPKVFWYEPAQEWRMVLVRALEHKVDIYGSPNLRDWTHLSEFGPVGATGGAWECPDLFPLAVDGDPDNVKWVMVVSLNPGGIAGGSGQQYFVGDFDGTTFTSDDPPTYTPPTGAVYEDFEEATFGDWTTTGSAFGDAPAAGNAPGQGGVSGYLGDQLANSFHGGDGTRGTLTSPGFTISDDYLNFLVGGGNHPHVEGTTLDPTIPSGTVFADFEGDTWGDGWTGTDDFAADGPRAGTIGDQQQVSGYQGEQLVNTFTDHDLAAGTITSPTFTIGEDYINLLVGGGNHPYTTGSSDATSVNLIIDGQVVETATGQESEALNWVAWDVTDHAGQEAQIQIVDQNTGGWGHILADHIMFSDVAATPVSVETSVNLLVGDQVVRTATGPNSESLDWFGWDVRDLAGETARIQIVDNNTGGWGHILADQFTFADAPALSATQRAHWLDYGRDFYAGVTFNDAPDGRRIMIAWMSNWQYANAIPTDPWRSAMSVPRELSLATTDGEPRLRSAPVPELTPLRHRPVRVRATELEPGITEVTKRASGDELEILATFRAGDAEQFGLNVRVGDGEKTVIGYDVERGGVYVDRTQSGNVAFSTAFPSVEFAPLEADAGGVVRLRILVDRSSVEVFDTEGRIVITDQVFPSRSSDDIELFSTGGTAELVGLRVWHLKSIWQRERGSS
jgi:fructan beta-fructosidase